jgi:hypothetical protein
MSYYFVKRALVESSEIPIIFGFDNETYTGRTNRPLLKAGVEFDPLHSFSSSVCLIAAP